MEERSVVALWRWKSGDIDFFFPNTAYFEGLSFNRNGERYSTAGRQLVQGRFGFNPRANGVIITFTEHDFTTTVVAFNLTVAEVAMLEGLGAWGAHWAPVISPNLSQHTSVIELLDKLSSRLRSS